MSYQPYNGAGQPLQPPAQLQVPGSFPPAPAQAAPAPTPAPANGTQQQLKEYEHLRPKQSDRGWNDPPTQLFQGGVKGSPSKRKPLRPSTQEQMAAYYGGAGTPGASPYPGGTPYATTPSASPAPMHGGYASQVMGALGQAYPGQPQPVPGMGMVGGVPAPTQYPTPTQSQPHSGQTFTPAYPGGPHAPGVAASYGTPVPAPTQMPGYPPVTTQTHPAPTATMQPQPGPVPTQPYAPAPTPTPAPGAYGQPPVRGYGQPLAAPGPYQQIPQPLPTSTNTPYPGAVPTPPPTLAQPTPTGLVGYPPQNMQTMPPGPGQQMTAGYVTPHPGYGQPGQTFPGVPVHGGYVQPPQPGQQAPVYSAAPGVNVAGYPQQQQPYGR